MKITHLGQLHKKPFGHRPTQEFLECVVDSQLKVIAYIKAHPDVPVLHEGLSENYYGVRPDEKLKAQMIFPNGIPGKSFLTHIQKEYLYNNGGVFALFYLGELEKVYKAIHPEVSVVINQGVANGNLSLILEPRQREAIACAQEVMLSNPSTQSVILVFGDSHDFQRYASEYPVEFEKVSLVDQEQYCRAQLAESNASEAHEMTKIPAGFANSMVTFFWGSKHATERQPYGPYSDKYCFPPDHLLNKGTPLSRMPALD